MGKRKKRRRFYSYDQYLRHFTKNQKNHEPKTPEEEGRAIARKILRKFNRGLKKALGVE